MAWAVAAFAAPALAGVLAEAVSWRAALLASVPVALIFLYLVPRVVGGREVQTGAAPEPAVPVAGRCRGGHGADRAVGQRGRAGAADGGAWQRGLGLFVAVIRADGRWGERLVPRGAFSLRRRMGMGLWVALLMPLSQTAEAVFLVYALQFLWEFSPLQAGLSATVLALSWSATQTWVGQIRTDRGRLVVIGAALMVLGQVTMSLAFWQGSVAAMLVAQLVLGTAFGASWGALSQVVMENAGDDRDQASGLLPVVFSAGFGIGAAVFGLIANALGFATAQGDDLQAVMLGLIAVGAGLAAAALALPLPLVIGAAVPVAAVQRGTTLLTPG